MRSRIVVAIAAGVLALMIGGCSHEEVKSSPDDVWPKEVETVDVFRGSSVAAGFDAAGAPLVVGGAGVWRYRQSTLHRSAMFAQGFQLVFPVPRSTEPVLGGPVQVASKVVFERPRTKRCSNGEGVTQLVQYTELVLLDPEDPARSEIVTSTAGHFSCVRAYQSPDGMTHALLVEMYREGVSHPELVLFSRARGAWTQVWSSFEVAGDERIIPWCYGFTTEGSAEAFVHLIYMSGDPSSELRALRVDVQGRTYSSTVSDLGLSRQTDRRYLGEHVWHGAVSYGYRIRKDNGRYGLLLVEDGGKSVRMIPTGDYEPFTTVVDSDGALGIVAMSEADGGQIRVFDADSGDSVAVNRMSQLRGAIPLSGRGKWPVGAALVGTAGTSRTTLWSVWALQGERVAGPWRATEVITDWSTPSWPYFGIQSMDELPVADGQALVLGLSIEHEAAIATVRIPE